MSRDRFGNLNLVFRVENTNAAVIAKQALPYIRARGENWPLPLSRSYFEYEALIRQSERAPNAVPNVYYYDPTFCQIIGGSFDGQRVIVIARLVRHRQISPSSRASFTILSACSCMNKSNSSRWTDTLIWVACGGTRRRAGSGYRKSCN